ncbi:MULTISPECIES: TetR family transcriptional regulator [unclassified Afipia]|uniref:TetR/AcrR family transcriptional regulator n=1 Tax=unclassified Afipia TaxID=2642050 RepID=UPI0009DD84EF|nr:MULTISPECIES: TetR family transcriptional regulator [unclassified Afipia]
MSRAGMKRTRTGARVPQDGAGLSYLGQAIDEGTIVGRQEASVGRMRGRVLLTAIALFAERGYETCSMRTIASAVGLKAPTLYNYYSSKEALLVEAIEFGMNDFFSCVLREIDSTPRSERLIEIARRHVDYKIRHRVIARANDRLIDPQFGKMFLPEKERKHFDKRLDDYRYRIHDLVNEIVGSDESVDPMFITLSVMNQWDRAAYWYNPEGRRTPEEAVDQMLVLTARLLGLAEMPRDAGKKTEQQKLAAKRRTKS